VALTERITLLDWLGAPERVGRAATGPDVDYHLTTLFPPVRPRGYLELRCLDALPDRWWPALAALTTTLVDDPAAADLAAEHCAPLSGRIHLAARVGTDDPRVALAVRGCAEVAARHCPAALRPEVEGLAELLLAGRTPSGELRRIAETRGPLRILEEEAGA
jgi:glutamate--cysteine ligase